MHEKKEEKEIEREVARLRKQLLEQRQNEEQEKNRWSYICCELDLLLWHLVVCI